MQHWIKQLEKFEQKNQKSAGSIRLNFEYSWRNYESKLIIDRAEFWIDVSLVNVILHVSSLNFNQCLE